MCGSNPFKDGLLKTTLHTSIRVLVGEDANFKSGFVDPLQDTFHSILKQNCLHYVNLFDENFQKISIRGIFEGGPPFCGQLSVTPLTPFYCLSKIELRVIFEMWSFKCAIFSGNMPKFRKVFGIFRRFYCNFARKTYQINIFKRV